VSRIKKGSIESILKRLLHGKTLLRNRIMPVEKSGGQDYLAFLLRRFLSRQFDMGKTALSVEFTECNHIFAHKLVLCRMMRAILSARKAR
jgi:hypothetical protein